MSLNWVYIGAGEAWRKPPNMHWANRLLGNFGSWQSWGCYISCTTHLNLIADQVHPLMATPLPNSGIPSQSTNTTLELFEEHDKEPKDFTWPPNSSDPNPIKHSLKVLKVESMLNFFSVYCTVYKTGASSWINELLLKLLVTYYESIHSQCTQRRSNAGRGVYRGKYLIFCLGAIPGASSAALL